MEEPVPMNRARHLLGLSLALAMLLGGCATAPVPLASTPTTTAPASEIAVAPAPAVTAPAVPAVADSALPAAAPSTDLARAAIDPVRPDVPVDLESRAARTDLWARVRSGFAVPDLDDDFVRRHEQWYASRPDYVQRMTERGSRYLFHIVEEVDRRGLPMELALLPFIESAFNPQAVSSAKASAMWHLMRATRRDFDLQQNLFRDDRRDVLASTRAALDYLTRLFNMFGDWHLALAAYNWGEGNVQRAVRRNQAAGLPTDYGSLRMPDETRNYVPKLQAVNNIVTDPSAFGLSLVAVENHPHFLAVPIERDIDVALAIRLSGVSQEQFAQLNPQLNKPVILAAGTPQLLLPYDNANAFVRNLQRHQGPLASWTAWTAPRSMRPADVAKQVGISEAQLREINRIPPRMVVKAGSTLLVPRSEHRVADVPPHVADNATILLAPEAPRLRRVAFKAGKGGDSVQAVARRYRTTAAQVAEWNNVSTQARFRAGSEVVVYVPARSNAATRKSAKPTARASAGGSSSRITAVKPGPKATSKAPTKSR